VFDHHTPLSVVWSPSENWGEGLGSEEKWGGCKSWRWLLHHGESDWVKWDDESRSKETTAARLFSSGTTGLPKAVEMTHYNFVAQHTMVVESNKNRDYEVRHALPRGQEIKDNKQLTRVRWSASSARPCSMSPTSHVPIPRLFAPESVPT
jgi:acyl-CoA synthetase (AMP-forming)/AMP-acid ligase II